MEATTRGGLRPDCRGYRERTTDWVEFRFQDSSAGSGWHKSAVMTTTVPMSRADAKALAKQMQLCFAAPYKFPTRAGFPLTKVGDDWVGVLAACTDASVAAARAAGRQAPCVSSRRVVRKGTGWVVRIVFDVPPCEQDPKAMG